MAPGLPGWRDAAGTVSSEMKLRGATRGDPGTAAEGLWACELVMATEAGAASAACSPLCGRLAVSVLMQGQAQQHAWASLQKPPHLLMVLQPEHALTGSCEAAAASCAALLRLGLMAASCSLDCTPCCVSRPALCCTRGHAVCSTLTSLLTLMSRLALAALNAAREPEDPAMERGSQLGVLLLLRTRPWWALGAAERPSAPPEVRATPRVSRDRR